MTVTHTITCAFCPATVADRAEAIDNSWEPSFWLSYTEEVMRPVCPECRGRHLTRECPDGECDDMMVIPGHEAFLRDVTT